MDLPAVLIADVVELCCAVEVHPDSIAEPLSALIRDLRLTAKSYLGLQLTVVELGQDTVLTAFDPQVQLEDIRTSLHLPLALLHPQALAASASEAEKTVGGMEGELTLYAGARGTFVDLAADLSFILRPRMTPITDQPVPATLDLRLDANLRPMTLESGLVGATDVSTINRALGILIGQGHDPGEAHLELTRRAAAAGVTVLLLAVQLLQNPATE